MPVPATGGGARAAAERAVGNHTVTVDVLGRRLELPSRDQLAFLAGLGVLAMIEIIEWPVAVAMAVGHTLTHNHHSETLREFGDALEDA
jgi:hypothetical protein